MCGRYALHGHPDVVARQFGLDVAPQIDARYNICPSTKILVVRTDSERKRVAETYRWGLGNRLANVRGETVAGKPAFRDAFRQTRCLVPASGFYEWQTAAAKRHPWDVRPKDAGIFAAAGITALWHGRPTFGRVTTRPDELM